MSITKAASSLLRLARLVAERCRFLLGGLTEDCHGKQSIFESLRIPKTVAERCSFDQPFLTGNDVGFEVIGCSALFRTLSE